MRFLLVVLTVQFAPFLMAQEAPRVELYTMGPGDDLFSKFGHAALCVSQPDTPGGGLCYNYGTSDFSRPVGLGWEVVRGRAEFWVSVSDLASMLSSFESDDRTVYRQELPLSLEQVAALANALFEDGAAENRVYVYNHFLENCSTRPRDHIDAVVTGALRRSEAEHERTYRVYALQGLGAAHWVLVPLADLVMGRWADRPIDAFAAMFIPKVLRQAVERELGVAPEIVYQRKQPLIVADIEEARALLWGIVVGLLILRVALLFPRQDRGRALFAGLLGGLGSILLVAAIVSVLPELRVNELLLVFMPTDFLMSWGHPWALTYARARLAVLAVVAVAVLLGVFVQPIWPFWVLAAGIVGARARGSYSLISSR